MDNNFSVHVSGLEDLKAVLADIPRQLRKKVILAALRKAARIPLQKARELVPVLSSSYSAKAPYRTPGLLKKRLMVRTSRTSRQAGNIGVFINVKPAQGAKYKTERNSFLGVKWSNRSKVKDSQRGAKSKLDPFYWRFVEFGTKKMQKRSFLADAGKTLDKALQVFMAEVIPAIERFNKRK